MSINRSLPPPPILSPLLLICLSEVTLSVSMALFIFPSHTQTHRSVPSPLSLTLSLIFSVFLLYLALHLYLTRLFICLPVCLPISPCPFLSFGLAISLYLSIYLSPHLSVFLCPNINLHESFHFFSSLPFAVYRLKPSPLLPILSLSKTLPAPPYSLSLSLSLSLSPCTFFPVCKPLALSLSAHQRGSEVFSTVIVCRSREVLLETCASRHQALTAT